MRGLITFVVGCALLAPFAVVRAGAQTSVSRFLAMTEDQQRETVRRFAGRIIETFSSTTNADGSAKDQKTLERHRQIANLTRAMFVPEADDLAKGTVVEPYGFAVVRGYARGTASKDPQARMLSAMGDVILHKHREHTPAWLSDRPDAYQEDYYRVQFLLEIKKANLANRDEQLAKEQAAAKARLDQMWRDAIVLSDGRRVLEDERGEFHVIRQDGGGPDIVLTGAAKLEAQRIAACVKAGRSRSTCR